VDCFVRLNNDNDDNNNNNNNNNNKKKKVTCLNVYFERGKTRKREGVLISS